MKRSRVNKNLKMVSFKQALSRVGFPEVGVPKLTAHGETCVARSLAWLVT